MVKLYCGNNLSFDGLVTGTHIIGTNYQCLKKGIGVGSHLPYDENYAQPHNPIDNRRFYCGNSPNLPVNGGYFANGSPSKCLGIGIGIGKTQRALMGPPAFMYFIRYILSYLLFFTFSISTFLLFYFMKPKFLTKKDKDSLKIDWSKFVPYYLLFCTVFAILISLFWKTVVLRRI